MKKYLSILSVPAINAGAILYAQLPAFGIFEELFKLLVLMATFTFTVVRIVVTVKEYLKRGNGKGQKK